MKKGILPKEISRALHIWFDERQTNDYGEIWDIEYSEAETALQEGKSFVKTISDYLESQ